MQIFKAVYDYGKGYNTGETFHCNSFTNNYTGSCVSLWYKYKLLDLDKVQYSMKFNASNKLSLHYFSGIWSLKPSEPAALKLKVHALYEILPG